MVLARRVAPVRPTGPSPPTGPRGLLRPRGTFTVIEGDHGTTLMHPDDADARAAGVQPLLLALLITAEVRGLGHGEDPAGCNAAQSRTAWPRRLERYCGTNAKPKPTAARQAPGV